MKKIRHLSLLALTVFPPSVAFAVDFGAEGTTIVRLEQRDTPGFSKQRIAPLTQFLGADVGKLADGNLSLHFYGWERVDLADRSTNERDTDGDFSYGYLDYHFSKANGEVKAGRFFINEGVAAEQVDGASARTDLPHGFALAVFTGRPVKLDQGDDTKGNFIAGGRGSYRFAHLFELGVSGLHETKGTFNPTTNLKTDRQLVGGDIWLSPKRLLEVSGHTFYNTATSGVAEHSYVVAVRPHRMVAVSVLYNEANFVHFFTSSNLRSLFNPDLDGKARSYGGSLTATPVPPFEVSVDYRRINRSESTQADQNGSAHRYGADARLILMDKKLRSGVSYHRVDGSATTTSYHEARGFLFFDSGRYMASLDGIGQFYDASIFNTARAFEVIASAGMRILPVLALSGDVSYGQNPRLTDEVRGVVRLTFNYQVESKGAKK